MIYDSSLKGKSGIYQIRNILNDKVYVGRSSCMYTRSIQHKQNMINYNTSEVNNHLLNSVKKYGIQNFKFEVLEFCENSEIKERESYWINFKKSIFRKYGYNLRNDMLGMTEMRQETKEKIRLSKIRMWKDESYQNKMKNISKINWSPSRKLERIKSLRDKPSKKSKYLYYLHCEGEILGPYRSYEIKESPFKYALVELWKKDCTIIRFKNGHVERRLIENKS